MDVVYALIGRKIEVCVASERAAHCGGSCIPSTLQ